MIIEIWSKLSPQTAAWYILLAESKGCGAHCNIPPVISWCGEQSKVPTPHSSTCFRGKSLHAWHRRYHAQLPRERFFESGERTLLDGGWHRYETGKFKASWARECCTASAILCIDFMDASDEDKLVESELSTSDFRYISSLQEITYADISQVVSINNPSRRWTEAASRVRDNKRYDIIIGV